MYMILRALSHKKIAQAYKLVIDTNILKGRKKSFKQTYSLAELSLGLWDDLDLKPLYISEQE